MPAWKPGEMHWGLALLIWTLVWRIQDLIPILAPLKIPSIATLVVLGVFVSRHDPIRAVRELRSPIVVMLLGLVALMALGIPGSLWPGKSARALLTDAVPNLVLLLGLATTVRSFRDVEWFSYANLLGALAYGLFVLFRAQRDWTGRLMGIVFYDSNDTALVLLCTLPVAAFFLRPGVQPGRRLVALASLVVFMLAVVKTGSRGGFLALLAVLLFMLTRYRAIPARSRLQAVGGAVLLLALAPGEGYWERMRSLLNPEEDYNWVGREPSGRAEIWKRGMGYMADNPLLGTGLRTFSEAEGTLSDFGRANQEGGRGFKWSVAHNSFVEIGAEVGAIALALFVGMFIGAFRAMARVQGPRGSPPHAGAALAQAYTAALIGYIIAGFFVSAAYFSYLYALFGLVVGLWRLGHAPPQAAAVPAGRAARPVGRLRPFPRPAPR